MIPNLNTIEYIPNATQDQRAAARHTVLAHDANAFDILEILGLNGKVE